MSGTKEGAAKCATTNKLTHGDDFYKRIGSKGGKVKSPNKGFGFSHERAVAAGRKGGKISKRGVAKMTKEMAEEEDVL